VLLATFTISESNVSSCAPHLLERDDVSSNLYPAPASSLSMIFSENRCTLFGIML
jgi:hypothetical protein